MNTSSKTIRGLLALSLALAMLAANCPELGAQTPAARRSCSAHRPCALRWRRPRHRPYRRAQGAGGAARSGSFVLPARAWAPSSAAPTPPAPRREAREDRARGQLGRDFRDKPPRDRNPSGARRTTTRPCSRRSSASRTAALRCPKGVIAGVSIEAFFRALPTTVGISDFNDCPFPSARWPPTSRPASPVVLDHGSVAQAMRASMSVPGAIAPVEINGRLLVDGGIANNLPIDEARKLCADVMIAVNISTPPLKREEITSALTVSRSAHQLPRQADRRRTAERAWAATRRPDLA